MRIASTRPPSPPEEPPPHERIATAFAKLKEESKTSSTTFAELAKPVTSIENNLHRLNLGIPCWTQVENHTIHRDISYQLNVGYVQVRGVWRLAIEVWEGPEDLDDNDHFIWPFNEAPQGLRLKCIDKLPALLEGMVGAVEKARKRTEKKVASAHELANAVAALVAEN